MEKILELYKRMSVENALLFLFAIGALLFVTPFGVCLYTDIPSGLAKWLLFSGLLTMGISVICIFSKHRFFIWSEELPSSTLIVMDFEHGEVKIIEDCPNDLEDEENRLSDFLYKEENLNLGPGSSYYMYGRDIKVTRENYEHLRKMIVKKKK